MFYDITTTPSYPGVFCVKIARVTNLHEVLRWREKCEGAEQLMGKSALPTIYCLNNKAPGYEAHIYIC